MADQKYSCKVFFPKTYPYHKRKAFVKDATRMGYHDGNKAKDECIHYAMLW